MIAAARLTSYLNLCLPTIHERRLPSRSALFTLTSFAVQLFFHNVVLLLQGNTVRIRGRPATVSETKSA